MKKLAKVIPTEYIKTPMEFDLSIHMRNLFNSYGEQEVRKSLETLFSVKTSKRKAS